MTRNRTTYQYIVLVGEYFYYAQCLHLHAVIAQAACHAHALEHAAWVRRTTHRTRSALTVVLAMGCFTHTAKAVTANNTLETFTFRSAYNTYLFTFGKYFTGDAFTYILIYGTVAYFFYNTLG